MARLHVLRDMARDFRDPAIWLLIAIVASISVSFSVARFGGAEVRFSTGGLVSVVFVIAAVLLDRDLVKHDGAESEAEAELAALYGQLGQPLPAPDLGRPKEPHNHVARVIVTIVTGGLYGLWWAADLMREGNEHFFDNWEWEDALASVLT